MRSGLATRCQSTLRQIYTIQRHIILLSFFVFRHSLRTVVNIAIVTKSLRFYLRHTHARTQIHVHTHKYDHRRVEHNVILLLFFPRRLFSFLPSTSVSIRFSRLSLTLAALYLIFNSIRVPHLQHRKSIRF